MFLFLLKTDNPLYNVGGTFSTHMLQKFAIVIGILLFVVPIYIKLFKPVFILAGIFFLFTLLILLISVYFQLDSFDELAYLKERGQKYSFYRNKNWPERLESFNDKLLHENEDRQLYPDNFVINDTVNNIIDLILRDFVESWFKKISSNKSFLLSIKHEFRFIFRTLESRVVGLDISNLLVHRLIPLINDHIDKIITAHEVIRSTKLTGNTNKLGNNYLLASNYNRGHLHKGIKIKSEEPLENINIYLSELIDKILPYLLEDNECKSNPARILVRELVSSFVLSPICSMLSDSDYYNQMIVNFISKQMKERNEVKKLRNILHRHSLNSSSSALAKNKGDNNLLGLELSMKTTKQEYAMILEAIEKSQNENDLLRFKYHLLFRNERIAKVYPNLLTEDSKPFTSYSKRCNAVIKKINSKLNNSEFSKVKTRKQSTFPLISEEEDIKGDMIDHSFTEVLSSALRLEYFQVYMQQRDDRKTLLDFWIAAESLRNPLDLKKRYSVNQNSDDEIEDDIDLVKTDDEEVEDANDSFSGLQPNRSDEIKQIFEKYFDNPVMKIPPKLYYKVSEFIEGNCTSQTGYSRAKKCILKLQDFEFARMKKSDFIAFKASNLWIELLVEEMLLRKSKTYLNTENIAGVVPDIASSAKTEKTKQKNIDPSAEDPLSTYDDNEDGKNYIDVNTTGKISDTVVKAVEDALNEIMNEDIKAQEVKKLNDLTDKRNSRLISEDLAKDLFGTADDDLKNEEDTAKVNEVGEEIDSTGKFDVFKATSIDDDTDSSLSEYSIENDDRKSPFDVQNISCEIERLDSELKRLEKQKLIIKTLLKKAEVINNIPESRILRKSLLSLEKEIKLKTLRKEQYIVQDSENSLYSNSSVTIPECISSKDENGKSYVVYVINVEKSSNKNPATTWMVTRRFTQFYDLHNYLKSTYPEVSELEFPKKNIVIKFIQGTIVEERRKKLEIYIQQLIQSKKVCSDRVFREFLSSEHFDITYNNSNNDEIDVSGTKLYNLISTQALYPLLSLSNLRESTPEYNSSKKIDDENNEEDADQTIQITDESEKASLKLRDMSFIKPICSLIVTVFHLNSSASWIRGKALVLLFQQVFGSTAEKIIRSNIDGKLRNEETVSTILTSLQLILWPDGNFRKSRKPRTLHEKHLTNQEANKLLHDYIIDTTSKIFGQAASSDAADTLYMCLQNEILNCHLVLSILDEIFVSLFPEIAD